MESVSTAWMTNVSTSDARFDPASLRIESPPTGTTVSRNNDTTNSNDDAYCIDETPSTNIDLTPRGEHPAAREHLLLRSWRVGRI